MLTDPATLLHISKCRLTTEERKKDERFPVFAVGLVLEPLTYEQARQLGPTVLAHCFTAKREIHDGLASVTIDLNEDEQRVVARMAADVGEHCRLRQVRIPSVTITKRDASQSGSATKAKKVGPQQPTLRATFHCLVDPAEKTHRDFLALNFGASFFFAFEPEQENLFTDFALAGDDDGDEDEAVIPGLGEEAGDVLDEQQLTADAEARKRQRKKHKPTGPRLAKGAKTAKTDVH